MNMSSAGKIFKQADINMFVNKDKWVVIGFSVAIIFIIIFLKFCLVTTGPIFGQVTDAINDSPITNLKIIYISHGFYPSVGGEVSFFYREENYYTDQNGRYFIPKKYHLAFPPIKNFGGDWIIFNSDEYINSRDHIYNKDYHLYELSFDYPKQNPYCEQFPNNKCGTFKAKKELNISLMPTLENIGACEIISNFALKNDCIALNAYPVALKTYNRSLCILSYNRYNKIYCLNQLNPNKNKYDACGCLERYGTMHGRAFTGPDYRSISIDMIPEEFNEILDHKDLCIAYCSWLFYDRSSCRNISNEIDQAICIEATPNKI